MLRTVKSPQVAPRLIASKITTANSTNIRTVTADVGAGDIRAAASLQNGNPTMVFDGSNDSLQTNFVVSPAGGMSGFAVFSTTAVNDSVLAAINTGDANSSFQLATTGTNALTTWIRQGDSIRIGRASASNAYAFGEVMVVVFTYDGGTAASGIELFKNGIKIDTADSNSGSFTAPGAGRILEVGSRNAGAAENMPGNIAEFGLIGREITALEVAQISSHLMNKYQIVGAPLGPDYTLDISTVADLDIWANAGNVTTAAGAVSAMTDLSGNGATISQGTAANRPLITRSDAGENRLLYSEDYSNAAWTKTDLLANPTKAGTFGDTGNPYFTMTANTTVNFHQIAQNVNVISGQKYTIGVRYRSAGSATPQLRVSVGSTIFEQRFDVNGNAVIATGGAQINQTMVTPLGAGWFEVKIVFTSNVTGSSTMRLKINRSDGTDSFAGTANDTIEFGEFFIAVGTAKKYAVTVAEAVIASPETREYCALPLSQGFSRAPVQFVQGVDGGTEYLYQVREKPSKAALAPIDIVNSSLAQNNATANILAVGWDSTNAFTRSLLNQVSSTASNAVVYFGDVVAATPAFTGTTGLTMVRQSTGIFNFTFKKPGQRACIAFAAATAGTARRNLYVKNETNTGFTVETRNESGNLANINFNVVVLAYYNKFDQAKMRRALKCDQREPRLLAGEFTGGDGTTAVVGGSTDFTVTRQGVGDYDITFTKPFARVPAILPQAYNGLITAHVETKAVGSATLRFFQAGANVAIEPSNFGVIVIGSDDDRIY